MKTIDDPRHITGTRWLLLGLLLAGIYHSTYHWLVTYDWMREDYNAGILVPFIVLYLIYEKREALAKTPSAASWKGLVLAVVGLSLFWIGELAGEYFTLYFSSWMVLVGLCWMYFGWEKIQRIAFPLCFLLAMFPLPNFIHGKVSFQLKLLSSKLGVAMIQAWGMSAFREGNVIDLGFTRLQVVDACSGLRYLIPLVVLGFLMAYFYRARLWKRVALVISTIPISVFVNGLRIASVGVLYRFFGPAVAEGFFHDFSGWLIFMLTVGLLAAEMWIIRKIFPEKKAVPEDGNGGGTRDKPPPGPPAAPATDAGANAATATKAAAAPPSPSELKMVFRMPQFVVALILLGATAGFSQGIEFREKVPITKSLQHFPLYIGEWRGSRQTMEREIIDVLDLSSYVMADFRDKSGKIVGFYTAYYESQRKGESIHSPATCLPGGGWQFHKAQVLYLETGDGRMPVRRALMQKGDQFQLVYYWFPMRGRVLTNAYQMKLYNFWDALTRHRTDGALVRVITPIYPGEEPSVADSRLQGFVRQAVPVLSGFLPE